MHFTLRNGRQIPAIAFGTGTSFFNRNQDVTESILKAYTAGFRYIDTAIMYGTETGVGNAVKKLMTENGVDRGEIFVATKVNADNFTYQMVMSAMEASFQRLDLDYIDLVLIHSPGIPQGYKFVDQAKLQTFPKTPEDLKEARIAMWEALQELKRRGKVREIGVSNFNRFHLEQLISSPRCLEVPVINQIEFNPYCVDQDILDACQEHGILVQAYAPLGSGDRKGADVQVERLLDNETLTQVSKDRKCTVAQVALSWALSKGVSVVTKTENEARMKENLLATNIQLTKDDIQAIDKLDIGHRLFWNPHNIA